VRFFADASFLYNVYYPGEAFCVPAKRLWQRGKLVVHATIAVILEFRIGALWHSENQEGWESFQRDRQAGKVTEVGVDWDRLFAEFEATALQFGQRAQPRLLDGLHVLAARQAGATHFISFDHRSRQRAFARAIGLKVLPERLAGEFAD